jgi:adenylate cyclase
MLSWTQYKPKRKKPAKLFYIATLIVALGSISAISSYFAVISEWWILAPSRIVSLYGDVIAMLLATTFGGIALYTTRSIAKIRKIFGRYLTDEVVSTLLETQEGLKLGGQKQLVTFLISDLRGFSVLSERIPIEKIVEIINFYLEEMISIIHKYGGTINNFMGDGIFVMFGAPVDMVDAQERAVSCAIAMQLAMDDINQQLMLSGFPPLAMGIGIHTGVVIVGNIGSHKYAKYTAIGSNVNLATCIETYTVGGQILVSGDTLKSVKDIVRIDGEMKVQPKGIKEAIAIYQIGGIGGNHNLYLPEKTTTLLALKQEIPCEFRVAKGKHLSDNVCQGKVVKLSFTDAEIYSTDFVEMFNNLKIDFCCLDGNQIFLTDIYAKVVKMSNHPNHFYIRFTAVPPEFQLCIETQINLYSAPTNSGAVASFPSSI